MIVENDTWIMQGIPVDDPECIHTSEEMEVYILQVGFLPLFANEVPGFSVEEHTAPESWWTDDEETDPWEWRRTITRRGKVVYGKFFDNKAGFISIGWLSAFANYRRDGYDFDARWEDERANIRQKKIMDLFMEPHEDNELFSPEIKAQAGFSKGGEKNFEGTLTSLEMMLYLVCKDFQQRTNKKGQSYGWSIAVLCTPEHVFGRELITLDYKKDPSDSLAQIVQRVKKFFPEAGEDQIMRLFGLPEDKPKKKKKDLLYPYNILKAVDKDKDPDDWGTDQISGFYVALGQLRPKLQRVAHMKYIEGLSNEAIGVRMNRSAGTVSSYNRKVVQRLQDPLTAAWYVHGYSENLKSCAESRNWKVDLEAGETISKKDLCLRIGLKVQHFESMAFHGIVTIGDLLKAIEQPGWNRNIRGIGTATAEDIRMKLKYFGYI